MPLIAHSRRPTSCIDQSWVTTAGCGVIYDWLCNWSLSPSHTGFATMLRPMYDHKKDESEINRWQIMRLILKVVGDRSSKFGHNKVDDYVQNSGPAITNRKRSQTARTWSCDQSCRVVPSIAHDHGLTSRATGLATDWATMRLVVPLMEQILEY